MHILNVESTRVTEAERGGKSCISSTNHHLIINHPSTPSLTTQHPRRTESQDQCYWRRIDQAGRTVRLSLPNHFFRCLGALGYPSCSHYIRSGVSASRFPRLATV
jgi:hypothetical protein